LVESLHHAGVRTIFGLPGDTGVAFYDALYERRDMMTHVLARDERSAAMMADAYARCSNRVGVVEASSGGGVSYVAAGLGESYAASVPVLVITSDIHRGSRGTGALTEIDQGALFAAVTKWAAAASTAGEIPELIAAALTAATTGRPAPVSVVIPEDILDEVATVSLSRPADAPSPIDLPRERPEAEAGAVGRAVKLLAGANRPGIVAGSGVHMSSAWAELAELAEAGGIPVATSINGKGAIAESSPLSLGVVGANGARDYANEYLADADAVLFVGTRANATDTNSWRSPPREGVNIIGIDIDADRAGRNFPGSVKLAGDARAVLKQLITLLPAPDEEGVRARRSWIAQRRSVWESADRFDSDPDGSHWPYPADVVRTVRRMVGDPIVIADPGTATPNVAAYWDAGAPGRTIIVPRGHGPMGYAIPAAVGAALASPGREIVAFTGDGSFAMSCGDLETAARLGLPITYIQFTNGSMGWIKMLQHLYHQRRFFGVDMGPSDAATVAAGFGVCGCSVSSMDDFEAAFGEAYSAGKPWLIDVQVPEETVVAPPVAPWQRALGGETGRPVY